ncbi:uncharacterized protein LOC143239971 [Tachypleus tridentatus]|uniref:uncharacterized protein LOC143239971 n=1 Tax=Tachypleus tridentatus TaxID=6853 RepID=UPI003FD041F1
MAGSENKGLKNYTPVPVSLLSVQYFEEGGKVFKILLPEALNSENQLDRSHIKSNTVSRVKPIICHVKENSAPLHSQSSIQISRSDLLKNLSSDYKIVKPFMRGSNSSLKNAVVVKGEKIDLCDNSSVSLHANHQDMCNSQNLNTVDVINYPEDKQTRKNILCSKSLLESNLSFEGQTFSVINEPGHSSETASNYSSPSDRNLASIMSVNAKKTDYSVSCDDLLQHFDQSDIDETSIREDTSTQHNVFTTFKASAENIAVRKVNIFHSDSSSLTVNDQKSFCGKVLSGTENCPLSEMTTVSQTRVLFSDVSKTIDAQVPTKAFAVKMTSNSQKAINLVPVTENSNEDVIDLAPVMLSSSQETVNQVAVTASIGQEIAHQIAATIMSDRGIVTSGPVTAFSSQELNNRGSVTGKSDEMIPAFQASVSELSEVPNIINGSQTVCNCLSTPVIGCIKNFNEIPVVKHCSQRMVPNNINNGQKFLCCGKKDCNLVSCTVNKSQVSCSQIKPNQITSTTYTLNSPNSFLDTAVTVGKMVNGQVPVSSSFGCHLHQQIPILVTNCQKIIHPNTPNNNQKLLLLHHLHTQNHNQVTTNNTINIKVNRQSTKEQHRNRFYLCNLRQLDDKAISCAKSVGCQMCNSNAKTKTPIIIFPNRKISGINVTQSETTLYTGQVNKLSNANRQVPFIANSNPSLLIYQNQMITNVSTQSSAVKCGNTSFSKITPQDQEINGQRISRNLNVTTPSSHFLVSQNALRKGVSTISNEKLVLTTGINQHRGAIENQCLVIQNSKSPEISVLSGGLSNQYTTDSNLGNMSKNTVILKQDHVLQNSQFLLKPKITSTSQLSLYNQLVTSQRASKLDEANSIRKKGGTKYIGSEINSMMDTSSSVCNTKHICVPCTVSLLPGNASTSFSTFNDPISVVNTTPVYSINQPSFSLPVSLINSTPSLINMQYVALNDPKSVMNTTTPVFNFNQPSLNVPVSLMNATSSQINTQYVALSDPKSVINTSTPVFTITQPSYSVPVSLMNATPSQINTQYVALSDPKSVINTSTPVFTIKQPSYSVPVSLMNATSSQINTQYVALSDPKSVINTSTPVFTIKQPSYSVPVSLMNATPSLINTQYVALSDPNSVINTTTLVVNIKQPSCSIPVSLTNASASLINAKHVRFSDSKLVMKTPIIKLSTRASSGNSNNSYFVLRPEPGISSLGSRVSAITTPLFTMANSSSAVTTDLTESEKQKLKSSPVVTSSNFKQPFHQNTYLGIGAKYQANSIKNKLSLNNSANAPERFCERILPNILRAHGNQKLYIARDIDSCSQEVTPSIGIHEQFNSSSVSSPLGLDSLCTSSALPLQADECQIKVVNVFSLATTSANKELSMDWKYENCDYWNKPGNKECSSMGENLQCLLEPEVVLTEEDCKSIELSGDAFLTKHFGEFRKSKKKNVKKKRKCNVKVRKKDRKKLHVGLPEQKYKTSSLSTKKAEQFQMESTDESKDSLSDEEMYERYIYTKYERSKVFEELPLKRKLKLKKPSAKKHYKKKIASHYAKKKSLLIKKVHHKNKSTSFYLDDINGSALLQRCYVVLDKLNDRLLGNGMVDLSETLEEKLFVRSKRLKVELGRNVCDEFPLSIPSDGTFKERTSENLSVSNFDSSSDILKTMSSISDVLQLIKEKKAALEVLRRRTGKY